MTDHPTYPIRHGIPAMDRCICGGVRHWHAESPHGCDDCDCEAFYLDESWRPPALPLPEPPRLTKERIDAVIANCPVEYNNFESAYRNHLNGMRTLRDALLKEGE